jgi:hypothetical protein
MNLVKMGQSLTPGGWAGVLYRGKILLLGKFDGCATDAPIDGIIPSGDMQNQLPNAVGISNRSGSSGCGGHPREQLLHGIAVPGVPFESTPNLVS